MQYIRTFNSQYVNDILNDVLLFEHKLKTLNHLTAEDKNIIQHLCGTDSNIRYAANTFESQSQLKWTLYKKIKGEVGNGLTPIWGHSKLHRCGQSIIFL